MTVPNYLRNDIRRTLCMVLLVLCHAIRKAAAITLGNGSLQNFRPIRVGGVYSDKFYRAASLDKLSQEDARGLLDGTIFSNREETVPVGVVIDLRNEDEIEKGRRTRTPAAVDFYEQIQGSSSAWVHVPILQDVDAFWDEAIARMSDSDRFWATLKTVTTSGALDRAAARNLEQGGLSMLYTIILAAAQTRLRRALEVCATSDGPVVFHCQKGKDRTGLLAMLLQGCLRGDPEEMIEEYAKSGVLIGELDNPVNEKEKDAGTFIDWSRFRGSPSTAMQRTLDWIQERHGSVESFILGHLGLEQECLIKLRNSFEWKDVGSTARLGYAKPSQGASNDTPFRDASTRGEKTKLWGSGSDSNEDRESLRVGILGAGAIALATAALLNHSGHDPMLWSPSGKSVPHNTDSEVSASGKLESSFIPRLATSVADLAQENDVLILCLPANGHKQVMDALAPYLTQDHSLIVSSHASFGALYLSQLLFNRGISIPIVAWGTTVATARRPEPYRVRINTIRDAIDFCTIPSSYSKESLDLCQRLFPQCQFVRREGLVGIESLGHCNRQHESYGKGEDWFQSLHITPAIGRLLEALDAERLAIADLCDVKVKTIFEHFSLSFHVPQTTNISEMNQQIYRIGNDVMGPNKADSRYILEDVPFGLVPTIILGRLVGRPATLHEAGVTLVSSMYGRDFFSENDLLEALSLDEYSLEDLVQASETGFLSKKIVNASPR